MDNTKTFSRRVRPWLCALFIGSVALAAQAEPPGRVGRLSWLAGGATLTNADGTQSAAQRNWPMTGGDTLATAPAARAEVSIGSTSLRLDVASQVRIEQLDDQRLGLQLEHGALALRVATLEAGAANTIDTPAGSLTVTEPGEFRVDARGPVVSVTAWRGAATVQGASGSLSVRVGQRVDVRREPASSSLATPVNDDFRAFVAQRDAAFEGRAATRYVSGETTGIEDLDAYGHWSTTAEDGAVWVPQVAADWAPYRFGHWATVAPWGWTWIDDAPWGFAPFHYGRWTQWQGRWAWVPGRYVARPVYAPALVGWVGTPGVSISVHVGGAPVGWFPLAPREAYVPPYAVSPAYVRNINVTHVTNITNNVTVVAPTHYTWQNNTRAMTVVDREVLTQHAAVAPRLVPAGDARAHALYTSTAVNTAPPVAAPVAAPRAQAPAEAHAPTKAQAAAAPLPRPQAPAQARAEPQAQAQAKAHAQPAPSPAREAHAAHETHEAREAQDAQRRSEAAAREREARTLQAEREHRAEAEHHRERAHERGQEAAGEPHEPRPHDN